MNKIVLYARCFLTASIFCTAAFAMVLILHSSNWKQQAISALAAALINTFLFFTLRKRWKDAQLIVENQILHIQPAILREQDSRKEKETKPYETVEMVVSCFGILLGSKIIKFNQEGIQLKAVEIGKDYLSIDYGTNRNTRNIRLLYARPDSTVISDIIEKFRYETGVIPIAPE